MYLFPVILPVSYSFLSLSSHCSDLYINVDNFMPPVGSLKVLLVVKAWSSYLVLSN